MNSRASTVLRVATIVLIVAIAALGVLLVQFLISNAGNTTPRTELERAVIAAEEAVKANPESAPSRVKLAAAYLENKAVNAARDQALIAIRLAPEQPEGYYILGLIESRAGNNDEALKQLTKAAETQGQLAAFYQDVWRATASVHERSGDTSEAIGAMDQALNFGPENAELLVARARLYEAEKRWADALYDFSMAAQFVPDFQDAVEGARRVAREHPEAVAEMKKRFEAAPPESTTEPEDAQ
jgi:tetratricopeptide (TPR) repeat protein